MFCSNCGKEVEENAKFCKNCGTLLQSETPTNGATTNSAPVANETQTKTVKSTSKFNNIFLKVLLGLAGLCVIIECFLIMFSVEIVMHGRMWWFLCNIAFWGWFTGASVKLYKKDAGYKVFSLIGAISHTLMFIYNSLYVWDIIDVTGDVASKIYSVCLLATFAIFHASKLLNIEIKNKSTKVLRIVNLAIIVLAYVLAFIMICFSIENTFFTSLFTVLILLSISSSIFTKLSNKIKN